VREWRKRLHEFDEINEEKLKERKKKIEEMENK
jgi:hypothetical protein